MNCQFFKSFTFRNSTNCKPNAIHLYEEEDVVRRELLFLH